MPLLRLWNSLRGRSNQESAPRASPPEIRPTAKPKAVSANAGSGGIFRRGPHAGLCRQLKSVRASSVLEISVGDGSRAIEVVQTLAKKSPVNIRYIAVDQFEMAGGTISLKQFFRALRARNISPKLFPEPVDRGLMRVAHTVGAVDLVLISAPVETWQRPGVLKLLSRVCHLETVVFFHDGQNWLQYDFAPTPLRQAA